MRVGEAMELAAGAVAALGVLTLLLSVGITVALGAALLVAAACIAYAAQAHEYGGDPVKRAESS